MTNTIELTRRLDDQTKPSFSSVICRIVTKVITDKIDGQLWLVKLAYQSGDVSDPGNDPIVFGTIASDPNINSAYNLRAYWNNCIWRILDDGPDSLLHMFGMKPSEIDKMSAWFRRANGLSINGGEKHSR